MRPQFMMMAIGTLFYLIGFGMFGVVSAYWLFVLAVTAERPKVARYRSWGWGPTTIK